jgi:HlyD family secretion protein
VIELEPLRSVELDPRSRAAAEAGVAAAAATVSASEQNEAARRSEAWLAKEDLTRAKALFDGGHISKSAFDRAQSAASQTEAAWGAASSSVKTARAELARARAVLGYSLEEGIGESRVKAIAVRSPVKGRVLKLHKESEGTVAAGEPLADVGDTASLEVRAEVLSSDAVSIKPLSPVFFERWGGSARLEGKVRSVEPAAFTKVSSLGVEEQRVVVISDIISAPEEWQKLGDGYRVEARFVVWESQKALKVPSSAVFRTGDKNAVFVVKDGRAVERQIKAGQMNGVAAEVIEGLSEGEEVVIHPDDALRDGARVKKAAPSGRK